MWRYEQKTGSLWKDDYPLAPHAGYSGRDTYEHKGRNNPELEHMPFIGPIPRGKYWICPWYNSQTKGPVVMRLDPEGHDACCRTGFMIHGDNAKNDASEGCIVLPRNLREKIARSGDRVLEVI